MGDILNQDGTVYTGGMDSNANTPPVAYANDLLAQTADGWAIEVLNEQPTRQDLSNIKVNLVFYQDGNKQAEAVASIRLRASDLDKLRNDLRDKIDDLNDKPTVA
jgi:hypothetical protein